MGNRRWPLAPTLAIVLAGMMLASIFWLRPALPPAPVDAASPLIPTAPPSRIAIMGSVPLFRAETADVADRIKGGDGLGDGSHPLIAALRKRHRVEPIDTLDGMALAPARHALLVQPRALSPEELVALDGFVRGGGRLLLFTDPLLTWPSGFALTDPRGPLRAGLMGPLLGHWGLVLTLRDDPSDDSGRLVARAEGADEQGDRCTIETGGMIARCRIGKGAAIVVADADRIAPGALRQPMARRWLCALTGEWLTGDLAKARAACQ